MSKILATVGIVVLSFFSCSGTAQAEPVPVADVSRTVTTDEGWNLSVELTMMTINSVPNMAATPFTREGFVTGKAIARIGGNGTAPVNSGNLIFGVQLGCQMDLRQGGNVGVLGNLGSGIVFEAEPKPSALNLIQPNGSINLLPGYMTTLGLGKKELKGENGQITVHEAHVKVDGCSGPVSIRFFAYAAMSTDLNDDSITTYGDILNL